MSHRLDDVTAYQNHERAARTIQRVYRGYRTRREIRGFSVAASTRGLETHRNALKDPFDDYDKSPARKNWQRAVSVVIKAGGDDDRIVESAARARVTPSQEIQPTRATTSKPMDLQYFLEMVDVKHRHGSNLRAYHSVWKNSPSNQNFFYWLDYGEGKDVDLDYRPRERLEKQQVRYLSPEERLNYMVKVDDNGLFRWVKNNELVETDNKRFKDSLHGVVHIEDRTPRFRGNSNSETPFEPELSSSSSSPPQTPPNEESHEEVQFSTHQDYELGKAVKKFSHIKPEAIYDHFAGTFSKRDGMWIFVADTSFRIYIGIKEPGAFQHSSFLRGGRIAAAGMLKIRHGQLKSLAPLSGHYRPHLTNFRAFHHSLLERGVDLSRVSISKSYAVLAGIEGYALTKKKVQSVQEKLGEAKEKFHLPRQHEEKGQ
ncbi:IQ calmodulin-binding motif protein [Penicillium lividum]|nr:IQ calmodulin-binding motif protein [Penicillium lividum]